MSAMSEHMEEKVALVIERPRDSWIALAAITRFAAELNIARMEANGEPMPDEVARLTGIAVAFGDEVLDLLKENEESAS